MISPDMMTWCDLPADDGRIESVQALPPPKAVLAQLPRDVAAARRVHEARTAIGDILRGADPRLLVIVGPCSIHDADAAIRYAEWLAEARRRFADRMLVLMRVYVAKPRTRLGWKGLINDPYVDGSGQVDMGLRLARQIMRTIIELGLPVATEFVDPITAQYLADLVSWACIGARTSESQVHRELASGLPCPVGFKNGTSGDVDPAINAVVCARHKHQFVGVTREGTAAVITTKGNADTHVVLRGGVRPNHDVATVRLVSARLREEDACGGVLIDCSHGNSQGRHCRQLEVVSDVCRMLADDRRQILGVMLESNLVEGRQQVIVGVPLVFGQSITDACLGLSDTLRACTMLHEAAAARGAAERSEAARAQARIHPCRT